MRHISTPRLLGSACLVLLAQAALACSSDTAHGPVIGAPTGPIVISEGGGTSRAGSAGQDSGNSGSAGSDPFGAAGKGAAGSDPFGAGGGDPFGVGGNGAAGRDPFGVGGNGAAGSDPFGVGGSLGSSGSSPF